MKYLLSLVALVAITASFSTYARSDQSSWKTHPLCTNKTVQCHKVHINYFAADEVDRVSISTNKDCYAPKASGSGTVKISKFKGGDWAHRLPFAIDWVVPRGCDYRAHARKTVLIGKDHIVWIDIKNLSKDNNYKVNMDSKKVQALIK